MSNTSIYAIKQDKQPIFLCECHNAFRGAMYVWNDIATRYFELECFPTFDEKMQSRIWNAGNEKPLTNSEIIVLASTMDGAIVKKECVSKLLAAFREYGEKHENSSIADQSKLIAKKMDIIPEGYSLAWIQTSVCEGWFREFDDDTEEYTCDTSGSFDVFDQCEVAA
jgi:hypothetical protein